MNRRERRAQERQPGAIDAEFARAMELHKRGQLREALALYKKLLARNPREPNLLNLLADDARFQRGDVSGDVGELGHALQLARRGSGLATWCNVNRPWFNVRFREPVS